MTRKKQKLSFGERYPNLGFLLFILFIIITVSFAFYSSYKYSEYNNERFYALGYQYGYAAGTEHGIEYMWNITAQYVYDDFMKKCLSDESSGFCELIAKGKWPDSVIQVQP